MNLDMQSESLNAFICIEVSITVGKIRIMTVMMERLLLGIRTVKNRIFNLVTSDISVVLRETTLTY